MQALVLVGRLGDFPRLVGVDVGVDLVAQRHDFAHHFAGFALLVPVGDGGQRGAQGVQQRQPVGADQAQAPVEALGDETGRARGNVDELAHQVGVDARHEVVGIEVDVFVAARQLGGDVVAQPFGIHAQAQILERVEPGAAALAHLFAVVHGEKAVHEDLVGHLAARELEHGRPEQRVEGDDVLADEVILLQIGLRHVGVIALAALFQQVFQAGQVADGRVEPDIEILARCIGNLDAEVGRVAADVPVAHLGLAVVAGGDPFGDLVQHLGLHGAAGGPLLQKLDAARIGQLEEEVLAGLQLRLGAAQGRIRLDQLGRRIDGAAHFAVVAVLVLGVAVGALALDEAVGQEHARLRIEELLDGARLDQARRLQVRVDGLRQRGVLGAVRAVPVVMADQKAVQIRLAAGLDVGHELLGRLAGFFSRNHDRRAVRIVGADKVDRVALHALVPHPDVGLDVFHDVTDVEIAVGIRQRGGDEDLAGGGHAARLFRGGNPAF